MDGNSGRNIIDAPGYKDLDLGLARSFRLTERFSLQFRGEASNALNTVSFNVPGTNVGAPASIGKITSAQQMRQVQLGLRLTF
jgi:hypothetical protein